MPTLLLRKPMFLPAAAAFMRKMLQKTRPPDYISDHIARDIGLDPSDLASPKAPDIRHPML